MEKRKITRRDFLRVSSAAAAGAALLGACGTTPTPQVIEKVVEKEVTKIVAGTPQIVKETVVVAGTPQIIEKTVVVTQVSRPPEVVWTSWATDTFGMFRCEEQAALFKEKHPDIVVQIRNIGSGYLESLLTGLAAGAGPDVFRICPDANPLKFWADGQLEQLDPWFEKQKDSYFWTDDIQKDVVDICRFANKLYLMPMVDGMDCALAINKTLFKEAGLEPPTWPYKSKDYMDKWSYPQYLEVAKALTKTKSDGTPIQFGTQAELTYWLRAPIYSKSRLFWMSRDGNEFLGTKPDIVDAIQWHADVRLQHHAAPTPEQTTGGAFDYTQGRLAMEWSGAYELCYGQKNVGDRFDWDVAPLPYWPGADPDNPEGAFHDFCFWCFNHNSKVKDATWTFYHWLCGPEGQRVEAELAWGYPLYRSLKPPVYGKRIPQGKNVQLSLDLYEAASTTGSNWYPWFVNPNAMKAWDEILSPALDEVLVGTKTAKDAMAGVASQMDKSLKEGMQWMAEHAK